MVHRRLVSFLLALAAFTSASVSTAPIGSGSPQQPEGEGEGEQALSQLLQSLHHGVTATLLYSRPPLPAASGENSESQQVSERITNGLCQFLAYYDFLQATDNNDTEVLRALLRRNLVDGCEVIKAINSTSGGVNITDRRDERVLVDLSVPWEEGQASTCNPSQPSFLHHYCTAAMEELNLAHAIANIVNSYSVSGEETACDWVASSLTDPHREVVYAAVAEALHCSNNE